MKRIILSAIATCLSAITFAQPIIGSNLTIFSEDGNKFFLILNGERQNTDAQTNIRVEDLTQAYYNAKIIFADQSLGEISKNALMVRDADNLPQEVVYRIKRDKNNGKLSLRFFSNEPVRPDFIPPSNVAVYHFGAPQPVAVQPAQTVVQTTTTNVNAGPNVNVNVGGLGMNININDPLLGGTSTTTTTTTTTGTVIAPSPGRPGQPAPRTNYFGDCGFQYKMEPRDFSAAVETIQNTSFDETKLSVAKQIVEANCLNADQVVSICNLFGFESSKLDFAKFAYTHTIDRNNYFKVNNVFRFSSSKEELSSYIRSVR
jgi:hypothetical protein